MIGARVVWRGLADTYENLVHFTLISLAWWVCLFLIVPGPAATLALFAHADPRIGTTTDRPTAGETARSIGANLWRGWRLALITVPILLLLGYNIAFYGTSTSAIGILTPFWFVIFVIGCLITAVAFSIVALLDEQSVLAAAKLAALLVGARLPHALLAVVLATPIVLVAAVLIVPVILFLPATLAAILNRFMLTGLRIAIPNPLDPTPERAAEAEKRRKWFGP